MEIFALKIAHAIHGIYRAPAPTLRLTHAIAAGRFLLMLNSPTYAYTLLDAAEILLKN